MRTRITKKLFLALLVSLLTIVMISQGFFRRHQVTTGRLVGSSPCERDVGHRRGLLGNTTDGHTQGFITDLFPERPNVAPPKYPYFVTAFSSEYFLKGKCLVQHVHRLRSRYPEIKIIIFDVGLTSSQKREISEMSSSEVRDFPFHLFPEHVRILKGYSFKPLAIQLIAREHPFVIWADASVRILASNFDSLLRDAETLGVLATAGYGPIVVKTLEETFTQLGVKPCIYENRHEIEATLVVVYENSFIEEHIMKPWVKCALTLGCIMPAEGPYPYLICPVGEPHLYHMCHRFDQSVLGILMYETFEQNIEKHKLQSDTFFKFCRGPRETWWLPNMYNEWRLSLVRNCNRTMNCLDS